MIRNLLFAAAGNSGGDTPPSPPTGIGEPFQGGYYVGMMNYGVPGENYWLITADKEAEVTLAFKTGATSTPGLTSTFDGLVNSEAAGVTNHPAMAHCLNYAGGGYTDWYMMTIEEASLIYRTFKPTTAANTVGEIPSTLGSGTYGVTPHTVPEGAAYTTTNPTATTYPLFQAGGSQVFTDALRWLSYQGGLNVTTAATVRFNAGNLSATTKTSPVLVRPIRRVKIPVVAP